MSFKYSSNFVTRVALAFQSSQGLAWAVERNEIERVGQFLDGHRSDDMCRTYLSKQYLNSDDQSVADRRALVEELYNLWLVETGS